MQKLILLLFLAPIPVLAQQPCKAVLEKYIDKRDRFHYQSRPGGYCEGTIAGKPISGQRFEVRSVLMGPLRFNSQKDDEVKIETSSAQKKVFIQARDLEYTYRLDAELSGEKPFTWRIRDVVLPNNYTPNKLRIFGYVGSEEKRVYVPLQTSTATFPNSSKQISVYLLADEEVENLAWRYVRCVNGVSKGSFSSWIPVKNNASPGLLNTIEVLLKFSTSPPTGEYCIDIKGIVTNDPVDKNRVESLRIWID